MAEGISQSSPTRGAIRDSRAAVRAEVNTRL
jgi:hypothetical protein